MAFFAKFINFLMPSRCFSCNKIIEEEYSICADCFKDFDFIDEPYCTSCGFPFDIEIEGECLLCIKEKPYFDVSRSIMKFNDKSKKLIHKFKYKDATFISKFFVKLLLAKYKNYIEEADIITCVPMHPLKRLFRLYNHSQILAKDLSIISGKNFIPNLLIKSKFTKSQTFLSKKMRKKNLHNSISINEEFDIEGKKILLIDDVITTGETIKLCSKILKKAKSHSIFVLSVAKNYK